MIILYVLTTAPVVHDIWLFSQYCRNHFLIFIYCPSLRNLIPVLLFKSGCADLTKVQSFYSSKAFYSIHLCRIRLPPRIQPYPYEPSFFSLIMLQPLKIMTK